MNSIDREQIRLSILRYAEAAANFYTPRIMLQCLRAEGFAPIETSDVQKECDYLVEKGFIARVEKMISPENAAYRISAAGRDFLAQTMGT